MTPDELLAIKLENQQASLDTLRTLSRDLQNKGVRSALHIAAKPLVGAMRLAAPDDPRTGGSRLALAVSKTTAKPGRRVATGKGYRVVKSEAEEVALLVGPNKRVGGKSIGYIGWFLEMGTKRHSLTPKKLRRLFSVIGRKDKQHPGIEGKHWMQGALEATQSQMEAGFYQGLDKWIAKYGR